MYQITSKDQEQKFCEIELNDFYLDFEQFSIAPFFKFLTFSLRHAKISMILEIFCKKQPARGHSFSENNMEHAIWSVVTSQTWESLPLSMVSLPCLTPAAV